MKKILSLLTMIFFVSSLTTSAFAEFSNYSVRMVGINPDLVGIVEDEYSDALAINASDALNIKGSRLYTNLSNLYEDGANDKALTNNTSPEQTFLLGGFTDRFFSSQMGLFYTYGSSLTELRNAFGTYDKYEYSGSEFTDNTKNNGKIDDGDALEKITQTADRHIEVKDKSLQYLFAMPLKSVDGLNLGLKIKSSQSALGTKSSEEINDASFVDEYTEYDTPKNITYAEKDTQNAKETFKNSTLSFDFAGRYSLNDKNKLGLTLNISPISFSQERSSKVNLYQDLTGSSVNLITADVNATNGPEAESILNNYGLNSNYSYAGGITGGFYWSNYAMGPNNELYIQGRTNGDEIGKYEVSGNKIGLSVDNYYDISKNLRLVGRISYANMPGSIDANMSRPATATFRSYSVSGDRLSINTNTVYDITNGEKNINEFGIDLGGQANLDKDVMFGFGMKYQIYKDETSFDWTENITSVEEYDAANDGFKNELGSADYRKTESKTDKGSKLSKYESNTLIIPLGFELRTIKKFPIRLGATHVIREEKTTNTTKVTDAGYGTSKLEEDGNQDDPNNTSQINDVSDTNSVSRSYKEYYNETQYYYGIGYEWSKNLVFDILGISEGNSVIDIKEWRISATLKF